jgi:hypothetical protein
VNAESHPIQLQIDADLRLAHAAGGAAQYLAEAGGLATDAAVKLHKAVVAACEEAFENLTAQHARLTVTIERYPDRIEIALAHEGKEAPAMGLDRIAGFAGGHGAAGGLDGVDRVQYQAHDGVVITRLTKYFGDPPHIA